MVYFSENSYKKLMIIRKVSYFKRDKLGYIFQKIVIKKFV